MKKSVMTPACTWLSNLVLLKTVQITRSIEDDIIRSVFPHSPIMSNGRIGPSVYPDQICSSIRVLIWNWVAMHCFRAVAHTVVYEVEKAAQEILAIREAK